MFATALDVKGASITIPYKVDLYERADEVDDAEPQSGRREYLQAKGRWLGSAEHRCQRFSRAAPRTNRFTGARAAILGTGGAARAVAVALASVGSTVTIYGRSQSKADAVARNIGATGALFPAAPGSWDILVNTTPVGMYPNVNETPFDGPFDGRMVYDLVYNPLETLFLKQAARAGCETIGGLEMLVAQAEDQSEWWLGRRPPAGSDARSRPGSRPYETDRLSNHSSSSRNAAHLCRS